MNIFINTWKVLDKTEKKQFLVLTFLDIFINIADIFALAFLLAIVQYYVQPNETGVLSYWLTGRDAVTWIALFFLLFVVKNSVAILIARRQFRFSGNVAVRLSALNLSYYQQAPFSEYTAVDSSIQIRKIAFQPFEFCQYLLSGIQQLITQSFLVLITVSVIILFNAKLFLLLLLILLPPVAIVFYLVKKKLNAARAGIRSGNERSFQYLLDALKGYVEANIYNRNNFFMKRFLDHRKKFSVHLFDSLAIQAIPGRIIEAFAVLGLFVLILLAQWSGNDKNALLTVGAFIAAAYKIIPGIVKLINVSGQMKAYTGLLDELIKEHAIARINIEKKNRQPVRSIAFCNLCFDYADSPVFRQINFHIAKGDFVGISGRSGRGKTTLFNLLLGFLEPVSGQIQINDVSVNALGLKMHWQDISYIRQQSFLINDTVLKNITLEEAEPDKERLATALQVSGLAGLLLQFPEGHNKMISENGKNISGGQQQRIAIARGLYKESEIFLLDEPFNELDEASEITLLQHFRQLAASGKIVLMITHDKRSLSYCNKIIDLDEQ